MISQLCSGKPFGAEGSMINGTIRIPCDLRHFSAFEVDQDPATAMAHPAMTFDHGIIAIDSHFTIYIRVPELFNAVPPCLSREQKKPQSWLRGFKK